MDMMKVDAAKMDASKTDGKAPAKFDASTKPAVNAGKPALDAKKVTGPGGPNMSSSAPAKPAVAR